MISSNKVRIVSDASDTKVSLEALDVAIPNTELTAIGPFNPDEDWIDTTDIARLGVHIAVAGQALAGFAIQAKFHPDQDGWDTLFDTAAEFISPSEPLVRVGRADGATSDLTTLPAGGSGWFILDTGGIARVKLMAKSANVAGSVVDAHVGGGSHG